MRRRLLNIASFISLVLLMIAALVTLLSVDSFNNSQGAMGWDVNQQQWVPIPPPPQSIKVRVVLISLAADAVLAVLPIIWLRRFVKRNRSFSRMSRGRCRLAGTTSDTLHSVVPNAAVSPNSRPQRRELRGLRHTSSCFRLFSVLFCSSAPL